MSDEEHIELLELLREYRNSGKLDKHKRQRFKELLRKMEQENKKGGNQ